MPSRRTFLATLGAAGTAAAGGAGAVTARSAETGIARSDDSPQTTAPAAPDAAWTRTYAGKTGSAGVDTVVPRSDGYLLAGIAGERDYRGLVVRTDAAGRPRWRRSLGAAASSFAAGAAHPDGGVVLAGTTNIRESGPGVERPLSADPWLVRVDGAGELVWTRTLQPAAGAGGVDAMARVGDGYLVAGRRRRDRNGPLRPWVARVSTAGHRQWARAVGPPDREGWLNAVSTAGDAWYVGGSTTPADGSGTDGGDGGSASGGSESALVVRLDPDGTTRWQYSAGGRKGSRIEALHADEDGVVALGNRRFAVDDDGRGWHLRVSPDGTVGWRRSHSTGPWNWLQAMAAVGDGYLLVGTRERAAAEENGPRGAWVLRTGPTGKPRWETTYFDGQHSEGRAVHAVDGGEFLVAGGSDTDDGEAAWLLKAGGSESAGGAGGGSAGGSQVSELVAAVGERVPPDADAVGLGALLGGGAVAAGRRLLGED